MGSQHGKQVRRHTISKNVFRSFVSRDPEVPGNHATHAVEGRGSIQFGSRQVMMCLLDLNQLRNPFVRQRTQEHTVDYGEERHIRPDSESEYKHNDEREPRLRLKGFHADSEVVEPGMMRHTRMTNISGFCFGIDDRGISSMLDKADTGCPRQRPHDDCQFKIRGVVNGKSMLARQRSDGNEHLRRARMFDLDGQVGQAFQERACFF
jgi:hypothetical protein